MTEPIRMRGGRIHIEDAKFDKIMVELHGRFYSIHFNSGDTHCHADFSPDDFVKLHREIGETIKGWIK